MLLPFLLLAGALGGGRGRRFLRRFAVGFLRFFFLRFLPFVRVYRIAKTPHPASFAPSGPRILAANHRSWLDALFVLALAPGVRLPVNATYARIPILGTALRWVGCVPIDRASRDSVARGVAECREILARGGLLGVFPEGTRSRRGALLPFSDFGFRLAIEAAVPVAPLVIHSDAPYLAPEAGSGLTPYCAAWRIFLGDPIAPERGERPQDLARRVRRVLAERLARLDGGPEHAEKGET
ncbi:MAG: lysophospholipid acyltransferase family protein [Deltaproteobacteria bacterium]|nr:lysophospholipid acyltransferase family protein [Deltaproteobacteria bacterium]